MDHIAEYTYGELTLQDIEYKLDMYREIILSISRVLKWE